jgi:ammonium transporter, Amt family
LAYSLTVGPRRTVVFKNHKPSNPSDVYLGTALLWFGWFGFNGGSEASINSRAVNAVVVSNIGIYI